MLIEHAGFGHNDVRAAGLLTLQMWSPSDIGRRVHFFPTPCAEHLAAIAAERPRWSTGLPLKKLQAEFKNAMLLVDGLAALAYAACAQLKPLTSSAADGSYRSRSLPDPRQGPRGGLALAGAPDGGLFGPARGPR